MSCTDCFRGLLQFFMVLINTVFFLAGGAVLGVAIWQMALTGMITGLIGTLLWVMFATGALTMLLSLWGCGITFAQSRTGLCCYGFLTIIALLISVLYVVAGGVGAGMLTGATECGFNPESVNVANCKSYEAVMNTTASIYLGVGESCNATGIPTDLQGDGVVCQNGDMFTQNLINSNCTEQPSAADFENCYNLVNAQKPEGADADKAGEAAFYFCMCPDRFTGVYIDLLYTSIIPGIVQSVVLFILTLSACCLMCMPKRREMVMQRYYQTQSPSQAPSQAQSQAQAQTGNKPNQSNSNTAGHAYV